MADDVDVANERIDRELEHAISKKVPKNALKGSIICERCGEHNNRAFEGYCICSDCFEESKNLRKKKTSHD